MRRYRDQETTLEQQYLADLVEAVERLTDVIAERIPLAPNQLLQDYAYTPGDRDENGETDIERARRQDDEEDPEPDIDDEPPPDYGPPGSGAVIVEYD